MSIETAARHQWASEEVPYANERQMSTDRDLDERVIKEAASLAGCYLVVVVSRSAESFASFASVGGSQGALCFDSFLCFCLFSCRSYFCALRPQFRASR